MTCPYCNYTYSLTWARYFKVFDRRHNCPHCHKPSRTKFRPLGFAILLIVCLVCSIPGAILADRWVGSHWRGLGVPPTLIVLLPLARWFESHKKLFPIEGQAPTDTAFCAECQQIFNIQDMIAHQGLHVCARCKPIFLQKLAEGAKIGSIQVRENSTLRL